MDFAYDEAAAVGNDAGNSGNGVACHPFVFYASLGCNRKFFFFSNQKDRYFFNGCCMLLDVALINISVNKSVQPTANS